MFRSFRATAFLFLALAPSCRAQSPAAASSASSPSTVPEASDPQTKTPTAKKVWTNDNLAGASGKVSVVGDNRNQKYTATPQKPADPATVSRIRESLKKLQTQLDGVNLQLASFKEFQEGEAVSKSSDEIPSGYTRVPVNQQIPVLEEKKKKLQVEVDDLLDEARKKGIEPGQLR
ncbi:MAG TPA: hypothetical protein VKH45_10475 [Candidatus Acidoferrum sp.]|nr:hypothetical protein [Candidatus Acidoferrum sp.]